MPVSEIIKKTSVNKTNVSLGLKKLFKRGKVEKKDIKRVIMTKNGPYPRRTAHYKIK